MSDTSLNKIIQYGTAAARAAYTPNPAPGSQVLYIWFDTDSSPNTYIWNGAAWVRINPATGLNELTGDVVAGPGTGAQAATIANLAVTTPKINNLAVTTGKVADANITKAKIENVSADALLGRGHGGGAGAPQEITLGTNLSLSGTVLNAAGGAGGPWTLVAARTMSGLTTENFTGLSGYSEILVIAKSVTKGSSGTLSIRVSKDNGVSYLNLSSDYSLISLTDGSEATATGIQLHLTNATAARSGFINISPFGVSGTVHAAIGGSMGTRPTWLVNDTAALNALQVYAPTVAGGGPSATMDAGTIYVLGRV